MTESIDQLTEEFTIVAIKLGINKTLASDLSKAMINKVKNVAGGSMLYIKKPSKAERNAEIKSMFNGTNHQAVCDRFNISRATIYRVISKKP